MKEFRIVYYFTGNGESIVEAETKEEAEDKWYRGNFKHDDHWGEDYEIESTEEVSKDEMAV